MPQIDYIIDDNWIEIKDPHTKLENFSELNGITFNIIGACFEVHNHLGKGFLEAVYKDALILEMKQRNIFYEREKKFTIEYKGTILPHYYFADFVIENKIILEIKAQEGTTDFHTSQILNYLKVSKCKLGLLINFGEKSLKYKRFVL
jgi:GxxExxY protein